MRSELSPIFTIFTPVSVAPWQVPLLQDRDPRAAGTSQPKSGIDSSRAGSQDGNVRGIVGQIAFLNNFQMAAASPATIEVLPSAAGMAAAALRGFGRCLRNPAVRRLG